MVSEKMDKFGLLLNTHSTPALPSLWEGRELFFPLKSEKQGLNFRQKVKDFTKEEGLMGEWERMKLECLGSIILRTSWVWKIIFGQYIGFDISLKNCVLDYELVRKSLLSSPTHDVRGGGIRWGASSSLKFKDFEIFRTGST